jgi:hypothetical protein
MVEIKFRDVTGRIYTLEVSPEMTVGEMKTMLEEQYGLPAAGLKMIVHTKALADPTPVRDLNIPTWSFIVVHSSSMARAPPPAQTPQAAPAPARAAAPESAGAAPAVPVGPPNFVSLVASLPELGFERAQCE